jgi:DnaD/phage-associated family protein
MANERDALSTEGTTVWVRLGEPALEAGYTLVPNLLLDHYETLGLTEGAALFVIRLLRRSQETKSALPDSPQADQHLETLRQCGLIHIRRWPDRIELRLDGLFYNLTRLADRLAQGLSPQDFEPKAPPRPDDPSLAERLDSPEFEAELTDVLIAFATVNGRPASPREKEEIRHLTVRYDPAARVAAEPSNGPAWVMAALRAALEGKKGQPIFVSDLEAVLEKRMADADAGGAVGTAQPESKAARRELIAHIRKMSPQEKEALETVIMAYQLVAGQPAQDGPTLALIELADEYGATWVVNAIHETGKVQQLISPEYVESILLRWWSEGTIPDRPPMAEVPLDEDDVLKRVVALYEQEIGQLSHQVGQQLAALTQEFRDLEAWQRAFAEAAKSNARNLRYVEAVLRNVGKKATPKRQPRKASRRRGGKATREGEWSDDELDAARREALSEKPIDIESLLGKEA